MSTYIIEGQGKGNVENVTPETLVKISGGDSNLTLEQARQNGNVLEGDVKVTVEWFSKWKWFTWAMKKHNFHWGPASHGSKFHRALGSIGNRKPTRTHKGKKMHGHLGNTKFTIKNIPVELVNKEIGVIGVRWGVPGWRNSFVNIIF